jgi:peptidyl-dipeptidase Dcp
MRKWLALVVLALVALPVFAQQAAAPPTPANPFFEAWTTPFGVPPFGRIKEAHYLPAFKAGIARERKEVDAIVATSEAPTFTNTVEALDGAGELLDKVESVFYSLLSAETNDAMQSIAKEVAPLTAALNDDINLNEALFARVKAVWEKRDALDLEPEQRRLIEEQYKDFVRGGANLDAKGKERLRAINKELSLIGLKFGDNVLKETNAFRLVIEKKEDLAGLPPGLVGAAAEAARSAKLEGKWVFGLQAPSIWPFLQYADNRELRRQILTAYVCGASGREGAAAWIQDMGRLHPGPEHGEGSRQGLRPA